MLIGQAASFAHSPAFFAADRLIGLSFGFKLSEKISAAL